MTVAVWAAAGVLPALPAVGQETTPPASEAVDDSGRVSLGAAAADGPALSEPETAERLQRILTATEWYDEVRATMQDGVVTLDGRTDTQEHRRWASALAEGTPGVVAVVNRIAVESDLSSTFTRAGQELAGIYWQAIQAWPVVIMAIVIIVATWLAAMLVSALARRLLGGRIASPLLLVVIARALAAPIVLIGLYFVLQVAGLTRLAITVLGGTGLVGIVIGFAFRDIAENFLASLLLSMRNPFRSGDLIEVDGQTGIVQNLNTRSTVLLTLDGNHVQIPNATVYKSTIKNYSSIPSRRAEFMIGIGYDSPIAKAQKLITGILQDHRAVLDAPEPLVLVDQLGASTVDLRVEYWFDSATYSPAKINSALLRLCKNALLRNGIELPDTAREVVFPKGVPLIQAGEPAQGRAPAPPAVTEAGEEDSAVTVGEGDLVNESPEIGERSEGQVPEAKENLLKD